MTDARTARLSLNQKTVDGCSTAEAIDGCAAAGIPAIGLWREPVQEIGVPKAARRVRDAGLRVSSLCRGGFFTMEEGARRRTAIDDNRRAIDEAAELGAPCLVLVVGGLADGSRDLTSARGRVAEALAELAPFAAEREVQLALEPMHPVYCADRGVVSTLAQALTLAEPFAPEQVGVVVDTFHVWWDPEVFTQIRRARGRIASFQVSDWITPLPPDVLLARGMMGDGHIHFPALREAVEAAGYRGDIEVEIFNADIWASDPREVIRTTVQRFLSEVCV